MKASAKRFLSLLASLMLLVATIFIYSGLLRPAYLEVNRLRGELASKAEILAEQKRIVQEIGELLEQYQSLSVSQQSISAAIPNKEDYPTLLNQFVNLTRTAGLALESVDLNLLPFQQASIGVSGESVPIVGTVQAKLIVRGPYDAFKRLLQTLETNIRVMDVANFSVAPAVGATFTYNLVVNSYYQSLTR